MRRPSLATVSTYVRRHHLGLLALFIALGGTSYAAIKVDSKQIEDGSIRAKDIRSGQIRARHIAPNALQGRVRAIDLAPDALVGTIGDVVVRTGGFRSGTGGAEFCHDDEVALSGGFRLAVPADDISLKGSFPVAGPSISLSYEAPDGSTPSAWATSVSSGSDGFTQPYVICATVR
jgi:hypothetical protein